MEFKLFLNACPLGIFVINAQGSPYYMNPRAMEILGKGVLSRGTIDQLNTIYQSYQVGTNQLYPMTEHPLLRALQGESLTVDDLEIHQGGQIIPLELSAAPIFDEQGQIIFAIAVFQDRRERQYERQNQSQIWQELIRKNQGLLQENQTLAAKVTRLQAEVQQLKAHFRAR